MAIIDGRTLEDNADAVGTAWVGIGGTTPNQDQDTFVEGSASVSTTADSTGGTEGLAWDNEGTFDGTDRIYYLWVNIANPGQMETKANGGIKVHVTGAVAADFVERYFEGKDTYSGGWKMFVIDMNDVFQNQDNSGGGAVAITAIQRIGITVDIFGSLMPKMQDNLFLDAIWSLPKGTPGIRVEGDNSGSPWTWQDIVDAGDRFDITKAWGHVQEIDGVITLFSSIEFGDAAGITATDFVDTSGANIVFGQGANDLPDDIYEITIVGNSTETCDVDFGAVVGSGDARQGIGGTNWSTGGPLFTFDGETDIADLDTLNLYSGSFTGAGIIKFSSFTKTEVIGVTFTTCGEVQPNDCDFLNNTLVSPADRGIEMVPANNVKQITSVAGAGTNQIGDFGSRTNSDDGSSPANPFTFTHTVPAGETEVALLIFVGYEHTSDDIDSVSFDTVPMRKIGEINSSDTVTVEAWILYDPTEGGTPTASITFNNAPTSVGVSAYNLEGVNRFSELTVASGNVSAATALAVTLDNISENTLTLDMIYADISSAGTTFDATAGDAIESRDVAVESASAYATSNIVLGVGLRDHDWTWTGAAEAAQLVIAIKSIALEHHFHLFTASDYTVAFDAIQFFGFGAAGAPKWHGENSGSGADVTISATNLADPVETEFENTHSTIGTVTVNNNQTLTLDTLATATDVKILDTNKVILDGTEAINNSSLRSVLIITQGTSYSVNDILTITGGTFSTAAQLRVETIDGGGEILTVSIEAVGSYSLNPNNPASHSGGGGSGATFNLIIQGSFAFTYNFVPSTTVTIVIFHLNFKDVRINQLLQSTNQTIPFQQSVDRTYVNP